MKILTAKFISLSTLNLPGELMTKRRAKYYNVYMPIAPDWSIDPNLKHMTEKVWRGKDICIEFDYPLDKMYGITFKRKDGWNVGQVIQAILNGYTKIYNSVDKYGV